MAFVYRAAWEYDQREAAGQPLTGGWSNASMYYCKKTAWRLCEIAPEVYGDIGASVDLDLEKFVRRVFVWLPPGATPTWQAIKFSQEYNGHKLQV